jgi:hypothetical protein
VNYDQAVNRLIQLARGKGGVLSAAEVEGDEELAMHKDLVSAAARALAGSTNVFSSDEPDGRTWFPYSSLLFSELASTRRA